MAKSKPRIELAQLESGLWAILERTGSRANVVETGHLDRDLAERDLDSWRTSGRLSETGQAWIRTAERLRGNVSQRKMRHGGERISREVILKLLLDQRYLCPLTGAYFEPVLDGGPWQPSVDRINSSAGYHIGNLRIVAYAANLAMNVWGESALQELARRVVTRGLRPDEDRDWSVARPPLRLLPANSIP